MDYKSKVSNILKIMMTFTFVELVRFCREFNMGLGAEKTFGQRLGDFAANQPNETPKKSGNVDVYFACVNGLKIQSIRFVRAILGNSLKEAKDMVDAQYASDQPMLLIANVPPRMAVFIEWFAETGGYNYGTTAEQRKHTAITWDDSETLPF